MRHGATARSTTTDKKAHFVIIRNIHIFFMIVEDVYEIILKF